MAEVDLKFLSTQVARVLEGQRNADQLLRLIIGSIEGMERRLGSVEARVASVELRLANMSDELRSAIKLEVGKAILQFGDRFDDFHDRLRALEETAGPRS